MQWDCTHALYAPLTILTYASTPCCFDPMCPSQAPEAGAASLAFDSDELAADCEHLSATHQFESGKRLAVDLGIGPEERVLDVGCGTGLLAEWAMPTTSAHCSRQASTW